MYVRFLKAVKKILIQELKDSFSRHPAYEKVMITGKYPLKKKNKFEIVVKTGSSSEIRLSANHFKGLRHSFCTLANVVDKPGLSIEWIREKQDIELWAEAGYYYIEILDNEKFAVDPLYLENETIVQSAGNYIDSGLITAQKSTWEIEWTSGTAYIDSVRVDIDANNLELPHEEGTWYVFVNVTKQVDFAEYEPTDYHANMAIVVTDGSGIISVTPNNLDESFKKLKRDNLLTGSEQVYKNDILMAKDQFYSINYTNGEITLLESLDNKDNVYITYRAIGVSLGMFDYKPEEFNDDAIPGVIIAFAAHPIIGDKHVIVIENTRTVSDKVYGGPWDISVTIDVLASDIDQEEELTDLTFMYLMLKKPLLDELGLAMDALSISGEVEDEDYSTINEYRYMNGLDITIKSEWEIRIPILKRIEKIILTSPDDSPGMTDEEVAALEKYPTPSLDDPERLQFVFNGEKIS